MSTKESYIKIFRENGFNCFPIPKYNDDYPNPKGGDIRYQAADTKLNQVISYNENYGVIGIKGAGTCIIDLDHKENYRGFAEENIRNGYMVIETPNGWHIPVKGLLGNIQKVMLFDYTIEPHKQIIEIQGYDHYVMGVGSEIFDDKKMCKVSYKNVGSDKIWDASAFNKTALEFHALIDAICKKCNVVKKDRSTRGAHFQMRKRFLDGKVPTKGTSNDYFYNAAIQCLTDGLPLEKAKDEIEDIYKKWQVSDTFSGRPWSNIEAKIDDAYENGEPLKEGRPTGKSGEVDRLGIAQNIIGNRKIYADIETGEVYENKSGFLEKITKSLQREVQELHPILQEADYKDIIFKLKGMSMPIPDTNKDLIVFKNGVYDMKTRGLIETDDIADMGFKEYNYLPCHYEHHPLEYLKVLFENVAENEHPRIKAGLRSSLKSRMDSRISVIYGESGMGKSTPLTILATVMGDEYAFTTTVLDFITDRATRAKIMNKRLLVFQDMPKEFKDYSIIKSITGEQNQSVRGFNQDAQAFSNKLKIWGSCNYLTEIPEEEKDAMYTRRLSLVHNIRTIPFDNDDEFQDRVATDEGEKIISWILNLPDDECRYEDRNTIRNEWEGIASPEIEYLTKYWQLAEEQTEVSVSKLVKDYQVKYLKKITFDIMEKSLKSLGYAVKYNIIQNIKELPLEKEVEGI